MCESRRIAMARDGVGTRLCMDCNFKRAPDEWIAAHVENTFADAAARLQRLKVLERALKALFEHDTNMWGDLELAQFLASQGVDVSHYATWWDEFPESAPK